MKDNTELIMNNSIKHILHDKKKHYPPYDLGIKRENYLDSYLVIIETKIHIFLFMTFIPNYKIEDNQEYQ